MTCRIVTLPGGVKAFVCGPAPRPKLCDCGSGERATQLCDWKIDAGTCDAPLCKACTHVPAPGKDLCPIHDAEWADRKAAGAKR